MESQPLSISELKDAFFSPKTIKSPGHDRVSFTLLHKVRQSDIIPLVLPTLKINNTLLKRVDHIKFLGILFDENLTWKNHINLIENKISKSLDILHQDKFSLNQNFRKNVYFSFIHSYINYGNIT